MKYLTSAASVFLLASTTLASPLSERAAALGKRSIRKNGGLNRKLDSGKYADQISTNWGGAVITSTDVTQITGTFTIPQPSVPLGGDSGTDYCGAAWVGIDGDSCQSGLIQTGVFWCVQDGESSYEAWYEYIDAASIAYSGISVTSGDEITVTVTMTGSNSGTTTLENGSSGQTVDHTFTNDDDGTLCGYNAEWIVEDFEQDGGLVPFADFGTVTFTGASAVVGGTTYTPGSGGAEVITMEDSNGNALTSTTISDDTVTVQYE